MSFIRDTARPLSVSADPQTESTDPGLLDRGFESFRKGSGEILTPRCSPPRRPHSCARAAVRTAHVAYVYALGLFLLNFLGTVILAGGGAVDGVNVVYALFNVVIYGIVGMYAFYCGYKGMATRNGRLTDYYVWLQSFFVLFQLIASSVNGANYYGWSNAGRAKRSEKMSDFFLGWTFFESTMWTLGYLLGAVALYRVVTTRKDAMRSQGSSGYGLRV